MLRISALTVLIALGASVHAANAGSFGIDMPHVTFTSATSSPTTPDLPNRACTSPATLTSDACAAHQ